MVDEGINGFIEVGSGTVLAGLISRIVKDTYIVSIGDSGSLGAISS